MLNGTPAGGAGGRATKSAAAAISAAGYRPNNSSSARSAWSRAYSACARASARLCAVARASAVSTSEPAPTRSRSPASPASAVDDSAISPASLACCESWMALNQALATAAAID